MGVTRTVAAGAIAVALAVPGVSTSLIMGAAGAAPVNAEAHVATDADQANDSAAVAATGPESTAADSAASETVASDATAQTEYMDWALRDSFLRYVGGATNVSDGATKMYSNGSNTGSEVEQAYRFQLDKATYEETGHVTRADFKGTVEYFRYCNGQPAQRGNCDLELTISKPTVVLSDEGSYVEADVRSKQYPGGAIFEKQRARIADIDPSSATFTAGGTAVDDGAADKNAAGSNTVTWSNLVPRLTQDGVDTFSGFYNLESPLASLNFTYQGIGGEPTVHEGSVKLIGTARTEVEPGAIRTLINQEFGVVAGSKNLTIVDLRTMRPVTIIEQAGAPNVLYALADNGRLWWVDATTSTLKSGTVSINGLENIKDETAIEHTSVGLTLTADVGATVLSKQASGEAQLTTVDGATGASSIMKIDDTRETIPQVAGAAKDEYALAGFWGDGYSFDAMRDFAQLSDGNYLYFANNNVYAGDNKTWRVDPLLITTDGKVSAIEGGEDLGRLMSGMTVKGRTWRSTMPPTSRTRACSSSLTRTVSWCRTERRSRWATCIRSRAWTSCLMARR